MEPAASARPKLIAPAELAAIDPTELRRDAFVKRVNRAVIWAYSEGCREVVIPLYDLPRYAGFEFIRYCLGTTYTWSYYRDSRYEMHGHKVHTLQPGLYIQLPARSAPADN